jgi:hypothetical protein
MIRQRANQIFISFSLKLNKGRMFVRKKFENFNLAFLFDDDSGSTSVTVISLTVKRAAKPEDEGAH